MNVATKYLLSVSALNVLGLVLVSIKASIALMFLCCVCALLVFLKQLPHQRIHLNSIKRVVNPILTIYIVFGLASLVNAFVFVPFSESFCEASYGIFTALNIFMHGHLESMTSQKNPIGDKNGNLINNLTIQRY